MSKQPRAKFLYNGDPWVLGEEIPDCDVFFFQIPLSMFTNDSSYPFLKNYTKALVHYKKFHMDFYMPEKDSDQVAECIADSLVKKPGFGGELNKQITHWSYKLIDFAHKLPTLPLKNFSNRQLWDLYHEHDVLHTKLYTYGWIPVAVDLFHNNFTRRLKSYLYEACRSKEEAEQAFVVLTTPSTKTIVAQEREDFLHIYTKFKKQIKKPSEQFLQVLKNHSKKWGHLGYIYSGNAKPFSPSHYLSEMADLDKSGVTAANILKQESNQLKTAAQKQKLLYKKMRMPARYRLLFEAARNFALTKLLRRHAQLLVLYHLHTTLLEEIAKRLQLSRQSVQFLLHNEVKEALLSHKILSKAKLKERFSESIMYSEKGLEAIYTGQEMKKIAKSLGRKFDKNQKELTGQTAQPGFAKGKVKIIIRAKDMHKMNKGDILVSIATDPDVVPAMKKAGAIVTEQGGITSHAAIVSRELGIPCIIGTKIATKIFKDGDLVEVDANNATIKKL